MSTLSNIREVAARAGVSQTAVSFVLNGRYDQLSAETVKRIQNVIEELDYRPSRLAKGLASKRTGAIGVLVTHLRHPVQTFVVSALVAEASRHDVNVLISDELIHTRSETDLPAAAADQIASMLSLGVDGIIASVDVGPQGMKKIERAGVPLVSVDRIDDGVDSVAANWGDGTRQAVEHLAAGGRDRLVFINGHKNPWHERALRAALEAHPRMKLAGRLTVRRPEEAYDGLRRLGGAGATFDSVYLTSDFLAIGAYRALETLGMRIPDDVAVVGFDDTFAGFLSPALTSVAQPYAAIGQTAFGLLHSRICGHNGPARRVLIRPRLVIRESCGAARPSKRDLLERLWEKDVEGEPKSLRPPGA